MRKIFYLLFFVSCSLNAQVLDLELKNFLEENCQVLTTDPTLQDIDLQLVIKNLSDKKYLALGEFNHGTREVFLLRNQLIFQIHKSRPIDLILFESGIGELRSIDVYKDKLKGIQLVEGFFGNWRNDEFIKLMEFVRDQHISIAGYDVQRTGDVFTRYVTSEKTEDILLETLENKFGALKSRLSNTNTNFEDVKAETRDLISAYETYILTGDQIDVWTQRTLENRIHYLSYMLQFVMTKDWNSRWKARDLMMANNVSWIMNQYKDAKNVIIIGHNFHISRFNENEDVMGEFLYDKLDGEIYVLGVFAGQGSYLNNRGVPEELSPPAAENLDIKHIIQADGGVVTYLDFINYSGNSIWLYEPLVINDTFIDLSGSNKLLLGMAFDGVLLLDSVNAAK